MTELINKLKQKINGNYEYFQIENKGIIINSDCLNIFPFFDYNIFDCFISDVPYKLVAGGLTGKLSKKITGTALNFTNKNTKNGKANFEDNSIEFKDYISLLYKVMKENTHSYIMVNDRNLNNLINELEKNNFKLLNILVWNKNNAMPNHWYMKNAEFIVFFRKGKAKYINNQGCKQVIEINNVKKKIHPTEKPIELMELFILNSTNENDLILDPFMGSGTTCLSALQTNRCFIGIEKNKEYFNLAKNRLEDLQLKLF